MNLSPTLASTLAALVLTSALCAAQGPQKSIDQINSGPSAADAPTVPGAKAIQDNSFLMEEAYNQEDGVIQHISLFQHSLVGNGWVYTLTDEWPVKGQKNQLSFSLSGVNVPGSAKSGLGWGDTALNYRYQLVGNGEARFAVAPRLSLLLPTGDWRLDRGLGGVGLQTNLPLSIQHNRRLVTHWNAGATWIPHARNSEGEKAGIIGVNLGQSFVWLVSPRFNALLETVWNTSEQVIGNGITDRHQDIFISPGVRWAYNFKNGLQIVPGVGLPLGVGPTSGNRGFVVYLSFEHPFRWVRSQPVERD